MRCILCGHENPTGALYCETCGTIVAVQTRPNDPRLEGPKEEIRRAIANRRSLDRMIPPWIVWINIILSIGGAIGAVVYLFSSLSMDSADVEDLLGSMLIEYGIIFGISIVTQIVFAAITYELVERHNNHSGREARLKKAVVNLARASATTPDSQSAIYREIGSLSTYEDMGTSTRAPFIWAFLIAMPAVGGAISLVLFALALDDPSLGAVFGALAATATFSLIGFVANMYLFYLLGKEQTAHENSWIGFSMAAQGTLARLGFSPIIRPSQRAASDRSFVLYFILTFFTGIFIYYWWYVMIKDPNDHYTDQWMTEDSILAAIGK